MPLPESPHLRLHLAIARLEHAADDIGAVAFSLDQKDLTDEEKALRDYYARVFLNLRETLEELKVMAARRRSKQ